MTLAFKPRESVYVGLEDVYEGELYLGWIAPAPHGRKGRDWWIYQPLAALQGTTKGREAAVEALKNGRKR